MTKEEKQRLRKEKKQQKKNKEKKDDKATQESEKEKPTSSSPAASQPPSQPPSQKGTFNTNVLLCIVHLDFTGYFNSFVVCVASSVLPAPAVAGPASETPAATDKTSKSKAELKAERRARQESERASKQGKKGDGLQAAVSKSKGAPSELQPGIAHNLWK